MLALLITVVLRAPDETVAEVDHREERRHLARGDEAVEPLLVHAQPV